MRPEDLILRCYGYKTYQGIWVTKCIDLALVAEDETLHGAKKSLEDAIAGYIETILDTDNKASIAELLVRKSPLSDRLHYHYIALIIRFHEFKNKLTFKETLPIHLPHTC